MYYLIEHNRTTKETLHQEFTDYATAQETGLQKEQHYLHNKQHEMEVVVFEADSLEALKRTHSRYFVQESNDSSQKVNAVGAVVAVGLVGLAVYLLSKK
ncbi:MAG: hypothetical protein OIF57_19050 [Marinobacterium sp.]|nr:hypothetical protein [Marinobacterium sp.]